MDENKIPENNGELTGFDAETHKEETSETTQPEDKNKYTLTSEDSFNTKEPTALEILESQFEADNKGDAKSGYMPSGNYGAEYVEPKQDIVRPQQIYREPIKRNEKKRYSLGMVVVAVLLAAVVGSLSSLAAVLTLKDSFIKDDKQDDSAEIIVEQGGEQINIAVENIDATIVEAVAKKVTNSVVGIRTTVSVESFFGGKQESSGEGSGVIYTSDGYIITNYHVIQDATEYADAQVEVFLGEKSENGYPATVIGYNISNDLAIIKINAKNLTAINFSDSGKLNVGQFVVAIGNPGGLDFMGSVTYGVISGLNRVVSDTSDAASLIQTDAAINPGNSGGALVDINGNLVGINSSKIVSEGYEGMGFAIPANTVKEICDKIISNKDDPTPYIGVTISERYDAETLKSYGYPVGAVVYSVASGGPADNAGIKSADIITEFNGVKIAEYTMLNEAIAKCRPEQTVSVTIYRAGRYYSTNVTIGSNNEVR